jgi:hypothetical protein
MSKMENEVIIQLLNNINEKNLDISKTDNKQKKKDINEKNCCIAAVKYATIGNAYKDRIQNIDVYLVKDENNGVIKTNAYTRCSKTTQEGNTLCHLHSRMDKLNHNGLKIFEKDILPKENNDKSRWLANINDDFFENMGKRGAKKKNGDNNYLFNDENHPILLILNHKNAKLSTQLTIFATQLLKNNNYVKNDIPILKENSKKNISNNDINNLISSISLIDLKENNEEDDEEDEDDEEEDEDDEELEEKSCIEILTINNKNLYLDPIDNSIYEPEGDDNGCPIGILTEISKDHHQIIYQNKFYTVLKESSHKKYDKIYSCVITDSLFDKNLNFIGTRKKIKDNEYKLKFIK